MIIMKGGSKHYDTLDHGIKSEKVRKTKRIKTTQDDGPKIIYQAFTLAGDYARDNFWRQIFKDASYGKFLPGFTFDGETINYSDKNKLADSEFFTLPMDDPYRLYKDFRNFLQNYGNIFSEEEIENYNNSNVDDSVNKDLAINSWSGFKSKISKNRCLENFIKNISINSKLDANGSDNLRQTIRLGISAGYFNKDTIKVSFGKIKSIEGLEYENGSYYIDTNSQKNKSTRIKKQPILCTLYTNGEQTSTTLYNDETEFIFTNLNFFKKWVKIIEYLEKKKS